MSGATVPWEAPGAAVAERRAALLAWYDRHRRRLPWRAEPGETPDPWAVLVSEIMLQQTTVATVLPRFPAFLRRFPTPAAMAAAPLEDVLHAWQGLGYYRRARALHAAARAIAAEHGGRVPGSLEALPGLPGLGPYTAAAVAAIAFGEAVVPVDGNVERVLARVTALETPLPAGRGVLRKVAATLARPERAGDFAQALMELGALVCTPRRPHCVLCPWAADCRARALGLVDVLPRRAERPTRPERRGVAFLLGRGDGAVLFRRRPLEGLLGGMIELPSTPWDRADADEANGVAGADEAEGADVADASALDAAALAHAPAVADWRVLPGDVRHAFSHLALTLRLAVATLDTTPAGTSAVAGTAREAIWARPDELGALALPTLTRKLLAHAGYTVGVEGAAAHASGRQASRTWTGSRQGARATTSKR